MCLSPTFLESLKTLWVTLRRRDDATKAPKMAPASIDDPVVEETRPLAVPLPAGGRTLYLPDMFASIMSVDPPLNKHFDKVKGEAEEWIIKTLRLGEKEARKIPKMGLTYLGGVWVSEADEEALRMVVDWLHWVFFFDDQFDEGHLKEDPVKAAEEVSATLALMNDDHPIVTVEQNPLRHVFQSTWKRFQMLDTSGYMDFRRLSIGAYPCHELVEYAHGLEIPQRMIDHPSIKEIRCVSVDLVLLHNDVLSYRKDLKLGVFHNMIHVLRNHGLDEQQAVTRIGEMLDECSRRWYISLAQLPIWGEQIDKAMLRYIWGCQCIALGNLHWSYMTGRYLGPEGDQVRASRLMYVPKYD
ncbi:Terpene synthase metal binding domain protein [Pleurostoma richardsiae]|uniref:Terpene synthase n=1 Tax=Pleurostoma richardsiae TaxID=41990 RepID=A0AA38RKF7_9PEZI|nr:Terpene synthase metal binding domain protein [Pleurostoma richardsiae]